MNYGGQVRKFFIQIRSNHFQMKLICHRAQSPDILLDLDNLSIVSMDFFEEELSRSMPVDHWRDDLLRLFTIMLMG